MISQTSKLLSKGHHKLRIAVNLIDQLCEHGDQLFDAALRPKQICNLAQPLYGVHLCIWILTRQVIDKQSYCGDGINLIKLTAVGHRCVILLEAALSVSLSLPVD